MKLSVPIPVYNEAATIVAVLEQVTRADLGAPTGKSSSWMTA